MGAFDHILEQHGVDPNAPVNGAPVVDDLLRHAGPTVDATVEVFADVTGFDWSKIDLAAHAMEEERLLPSRATDFEARLTASQVVDLVLWASWAIASGDVLAACPAARDFGDLIPTEGFDDPASTLRSMLSHMLSGGSRPEGPEWLAFVRLQSFNDVKSALISFTDSLEAVLVAIPNGVMPPVVQHIYARRPQPTLEEIWKPTAAAAITREIGLRGDVFIALAELFDAEETTADQPGVSPEN